VVLVLDSWEGGGRSSRGDAKMVEEGECLSDRNVPWIIEGRTSRVELGELRGEGEVLR
jgi:hypothetical protein